eukprot:TRINITY_DN7451_c0_g1_i1.p2 TRINITY_DN7451_c0_g1~~TRINITY_DN7451_c0_g1_i1.p2  ORF type:complete len:161 (-),score=7.23 TRINITY_DN7451_c0_g1_i1:17-499(-)
MLFLFSTIILITMLQDINNFVSSRTWQKIWFLVQILIIFLKSYHFLFKKYFYTHYQYPIQKENFPPYHGELLLENLNSITAITKELALGSIFTSKAIINTMLVNKNIITAATIAVSYTHLTLPTKRIVYILVVALALKKKHNKNKDTITTNSIRLATNDE